MSDTVICEACGVAATSLETIARDSGSMNLWAVAALLRSFQSSTSPLSETQKDDAIRYIALSLKFIAEK